MSLVSVIIEDKLPLLTLPLHTLIRETAEMAALNEGVTVAIEVGVAITGDEDIKELNKKHLGRDCPTDVLSFPMLEFETPGVIIAERADFDGDKLLLGDIVISAERAAEQAKNLGHTLEREIGFLTAHAMLHLLGYDHANAQQEEVMFKKQEAVLDRLGLKRRAD